MLDENNPTHAEVLNKIKTRFREETFTRESIKEVIQNHPELVSFRHTYTPLVEAEGRSVCFTSTLPWFTVSPISHHGSLPHPLIRTQILIAHRSSFPSPIPSLLTRSASLLTRSLSPWPLRVARFAR